MPQLQDVRLCLFDAYGTLFDVHSAAARAREELGEDWDRLSQAWRVRQLHYTWLRSLMRQHVDFRQVTADALDFALDVVGLQHRTALRERLLGFYDQLDVYPDVVPTLQGLRARGIRTAILSNGSPDMLQAAAAHAGLTDHLDAILSVEDVGVFKPDPRVYGIGEQRLGIERAHTTFQTSNAWDAHGAASAGLRVVWCNRFSQPAERLPGTPAAEVTHLTTLLELVS